MASPSTTLMDLAAFSPVPRLPLPTMDGKWSIDGYMASLNAIANRFPQKRTSRMEVAMRSPPRAKHITHSAYLGLEAFVLRGRLKLREGPELTTEPAGFLPPSAVVCVLEQAELSDGTHRVKVARFGESTPLGWVSSISKERARNLIPFHFTRFQRFAKPAAPPKTATNMYQIDKRAEDNDGSLSPEGNRSTPPDSPTSPTSGSKKKRNSVAPPPRRSGTPSDMSDDASPTNFGAALGAVQFAAKMKAAPEKKDTKTSERDIERFKPQKAEQLQQAVGDFQAQITEAEQELEATLKPTNSLDQLKIKLGTALLNSDTKLSELVKTWGMNKKGKSTGEIGQIDFRMHVRKVIEWTNVKDIDNLFAKVDTDNTRSVSTNEMTMFMKKVLEAARDRDAETASVQTRIDFIRSRIALVERAVEATQSAENAVEKLRLEHEVNSQKTRTRLGKEMLRRATKIADLLNGWESTRGQMDKKQFRKNVRSYGIEDSNDNLDEVFDSYDKDGGGSLDLEELKVALTNLREEAANSERSLKDLKKRTEQLWKGAKSAQLELKKKQRADELRAKEEEAEKAKEQEMRAAAAEEAKAARDAAREAKKLQEAEEQAAYQAKIEKRRRKSIGDDDELAATFAAVMSNAAAQHSSRSPSPSPTPSPPNTGLTVSVGRKEDPSAVAVRVPAKRGGK